ncbi:MAG: hypothetical protein JNL79_22495 [Myxococcales bacterium]|nr:hypothetical protein [Myxococcales bacterium]
MDHSKKEGARPHPVGSSPQPQLERRTFLQALALGTTCVVAPSVVGCASPTERRTQPTAILAVTETTAPAVTTEEGDAVYQVTRPVAVPLTARPSSDLLGPRVKPYARGLWFTPAELRLQLTYVISNLAGADVLVELMLDTWNEFVYYAPTVTISEEEGLSADRSTIDRLIRVPAKSRVVGSVSFDDFERAAMALAIMIDPLRPNDFHLVDPQTNLKESPLVKPYLPSAIDGITGFDLSMRINGKAKVVLEATLELEDRTGNLLVTGPDSESPNRTKQSMGRQPLVPRVLAPPV